MTIQEQNKGRSTLPIGKKLSLGNLFSSRAYKVINCQQFRITVEREIALCNEIEGFGRIAIELNASARKNYKNSDKFLISKLKSFINFDCKYFLVKDKEHNCFFIYEDGERMIKNLEEYDEIMELR